MFALEYVHLIKRIFAKATAEKRNDERSRSDLLFNFLRGGFSDFSPLVS